MEHLEEIILLLYPNHNSVRRVDSSDASEVKFGVDDARESTRRIPYNSVVQGLRDLET